MNALHNIWTVAFIFAYFFEYALLAWVAVACRGVSLRLTKKEVLLLGIFLALIASELIQLLAEYSGSSTWSKISIWGYPRYFSSFAPLLWIWLAYAISRCFDVSNKKLKYLLVGICIAAVGFVALNENIRYFFYETQFGKGVDAMVAAKRFAKVIRYNYAGPKTTPGFKYSEKEYHSAHRPVVFGNFGAGAWAVRGQSAAPNHTYPGEPDYLLLNFDDGGYSSPRNFDPNDFDLIGRTQGSTSRWALYRRKGVQHR